MGHQRALQSAGFIKRRRNALDRACRRIPVPPSVEKLLKRGESTPEDDGAGEQRAEIGGLFKNQQCAATEHGQLHGETKASRRAQNDRLAFRSAHHRGDHCGVLSAPSPGDVAQHPHGINDFAATQGIADLAIGGLRTIAALPGWCSGQQIVCNGHDQENKPGAETEPSKVRMHEEEGPEEHRCPNHFQSGGKRASRHEVAQQPDIL